MNERRSLPILRPASDPGALALGKNEGKSNLPQEYLTFGLAGETYAMPLGVIVEVLRWSPVTSIPTAPADVLGVLRVRTQMVTVLDLRRRLHLAESAPGAAHRILLIRQEGEIVGLLVDEVFRICRLASAPMETTSPLRTFLGDAVLGVARFVDRRKVTHEAVDMRQIATTEPLVLILSPQGLLRPARPASQG